MLKYIVWILPEFYERVLYSPKPYFVRIFKKYLQLFFSRKFKKKINSVHQSNRPYITSGVCYTCTILTNATGLAAIRISPRLASIGRIQRAIRQLKKKKLENPDGDPLVLKKKEYQRNQFITIPSSFLFNIVIDLDI